MARNDLHRRRRSVSSHLGHGLYETKQDNRDPSSLLDKHSFQFPSCADFADDGDSTSEASIWVGTACSGDDLNAPGVLKTKSDTVG